MSTENEKIQDAVYEEVIEKVNYEVSVELTDNFLEKNPTIKEMYKKGKINIGLLPNVDKSFVDGMVELIPELSQNELVLFNPIISAINELASQDFIKEEPIPRRMDYEEEKDFNKRKKTWLESQYRKLTDVTNSIKSFNGSLTKTKKTMKDPILEKGRKIDSLYKILSSFSEKRKEIAQSNFPQYLAAIKKIQEAKAAKTLAEEKKKQEELEKQNKESQEKIAALQSKGSYADIVKEITIYFNEKTEAVETSNEAGLRKIIEEIEAKEFDISSQAPAEQIHLAEIAKNFKEVLVNKINNLISVPSTTVTEGLKSAPLTQTESSPTFNTEVVTDEDNFADIIRRLNSIKGEIRGMKHFQNPKLKKINEQFFEKIAELSSLNERCLKAITITQEKFNSKK